jgi:hypothetical protein
MSDIEFLIHEVRTEAGVTFASGIVNKGNIRVGTTFTSVRQVESGTHEFHLSVKKVVAYRREIDDLPSGMSGELTLEGQRAELLREHDMLEA